MNLNKHQRETLRLKYGGFCAYCGNALTDKWHADHLKPLRREGKWVPAGYKRMEYVQTGTSQHPERDTLDNFMPACVPCNIHKSDSSLEQWRRLLEDSHRALTENYSTYRHAKRFGLIIETPPKVVFHFERFTMPSENHKPRRRINL